MAEENEGIAYLLALKRSAGSAAPAPTREENPSQTNLDKTATSPAFEGAEKRRSPRYQCEGSVEMREIDCEVHTWASFTDISLHGCYVEAQATYPVGTLLNLKLEAKGMRVETKGDVRVSYPYLGMGIQFLEMTAENEARLRDLLALVSSPSMIMGPGIASTLPARGPLELPAITNPDAIVQGLQDFFRDRQMLMRDDFVRIVRQSQNAVSKS
jgi:PilZ domain